LLPCCLAALLPCCLAALLPCCLAALLPNLYFANSHLFMFYLCIQKNL